MAGARPHDGMNEGRVFQRRCKDGSLFFLDGELGRSENAFVVWRFLGGTVYAAEPQLRPSVQVVSGHLFEGHTGQWGSADVFAPAFVPVNQVQLSRFFAGVDGKVRIPMLFYRRLPCQPLELTIGDVGTTGASVAAGRVSLRRVGA